MSRNKEMSTEKVSIYVDLIHETENAYLMSDGENEFWISKYRLLNMDKMGDAEYEIILPEWLAEEKGII